MINHDPTPNLRGPFGLTAVRETCDEWPAVTTLPAASNVTLMNRTAGPDSIPHEEMAAHAANYKSAAGYGIEETSASPPTIPAGARIGDSTRAG